MKTKSTSVRAAQHRLEAGEMVLIRVGQHLFRQWRREGRSDPVLERSYRCVWAFKREIRAEKRALTSKPSDSASGGVLD